MTRFYHVTDPRRVPNFSLSGAKQSFILNLSLSISIRWSISNPRNLGHEGTESTDRFLPCCVSACTFSLCLLTGWSVFSNIFCVDTSSFSPFRRTSDTYFRPSYIPEAQWVESASPKARLIAILPKDLPLILTRESPEREVVPGNILPDRSHLLLQCPKGVGAVPGKMAPSDVRSLDLLSSILASNRTDCAASNSTLATPQAPKRPVGRPRKPSVQNGKETPSQSTETKPADTNTTDDNSDRSYWLMKAEPESRIEKGVDVKFSIDDLQAATKPEPWDGVRNAVARNHIRAMKKGDYAFFYHSNCKVPGIVGMMEIVQEHTPDESAFDPAHPYYDARSNRDNPKWEVVHVEFRRKFKTMVTLNDLKEHGKSGGPLANLQVLKQTRLSVSSVTPAEWKFILELAGEME